MRNHQKTKAEDLHYLEAGDMHPANTYFHFSFANYYDPRNMNYGVLRVLNDDNVKPHSGFDTHPHSEMEIFSYVVDGKLTHRDSAGNHEILSRGDAQCISAGTGVTHSELNEQDDWCRFLQIWIVPGSRGLPVRYDLHRFSPEDRKNKLLHVISGPANRAGACLYVCQDINVHVSELTDKGARVSYVLNEDRQAYIYCFEGGVDIDRHASLTERDSLRVRGDASLEFSLATDKAHFIIIEMPLEASA
ncbi:MAG: pirin family protein [Rhodospirillaceae bacterium]|nr:pirin family protein [Rhodospirillaceae bacterium]